MTTLARDLLLQAQHLATQERGRPKQASLRQAVSAAYYALFHRLAFDGAAFLVGYGQRNRAGANLAARACDHGSMAAAARSFAGGTLSTEFARAVGISRVPNELRFVAETFVELQQARHSADYDLDSAFSRFGALELVFKAEQATAVWTAFKRKDQPFARIFVLALLSGRTLQRR